MSPPKPLTLSRLVVFGIKTACAVIVVICSLFTLFTVGPSVETRFFPVVSKLKITKILAEGESSSRIYAEFDKKRDCEYIGISWFHGHPAGDFERVPVSLLRREGDSSSPNRPLGLQKAGPWIVSVPPAELRKNSFARLTHRCHLFWVSTTDFWP